MCEILLEFEGLTKQRTKTVMKKIDHCGFKNIITHIEVQCCDFDVELPVADQSQDTLDLQPVQSNSIYIKCELLSSAAKFTGKGDATHLVESRNLSPHVKLLSKGRMKNHKPILAVIQTESPIEDEVETFDLVIKKDIEFYNPSKSECIGWYNKEANILWISDLIHNPLRSEMLLDRVVSYVYELQKYGSLDVITPVFEKYTKELEKRGFSGACLWWTGFEDKKDAAYIDGKIDGAKLLEAEADKLISAGVDIFFLRSLKNSASDLEITTDKCEGKVVIQKQGYGDTEIQVPAHTTLEQEVASIEAYVTKYATKIAREFYEKVRAEIVESKNEEDVQDKLA